METIVVIEYALAGMGLACTSMAGFVALSDMLARKKVRHRRRKVDEDAKVFNKLATHEQQRNEELAEKKRVNQEKASACRLLNLDPGANNDKKRINTAWRQVMKLSHPDATGMKDDTLSKNATAARNFLLKYYAGP